MKKYFVIGILFLTVFSTPAFATVNTIPEQQMKKVPFPVLEKEVKQEKVVLSSYDEYSWVNEGSHRGNWNLLENSAYYSVTDWLTAYSFVDVWKRFAQTDETINGGAYVKFPDKSYLRTEMGWGANISYVYRWQTTLEYERPVYRGLSMNVLGKYLNYAEDDVWIGSPGLRYYFKDHYISAGYNISATNSRGTAHWANAKANYALTDWFHLWVGTAIGERLYDIQDEKKASKQFGYIISFGGALRVYKHFYLTAGYSYSHENRDFIKRDLDFGLTVKF